MANNLTTNPWVIDTAGAALLWPATVFVDHFEFANYTADTDTVVVKNRAGINAWSDNGASDLRTIRSGHIGAVHGGLSVPTLSSGLLYIYLGGKAT